MSTQASNVLTLNNVARRFPNRIAGAAPFTAVRNLSFHIDEGEFVSIVGPSGCGKSTLLNLVAGLDRPSEGTVVLHGVEVSGPNASVGFMLQKDLLLPWRTVLHNVEFGLEARNLSAAERRERAMRELKRCRLLEFADRYPYQISGGQRQRAALARTLAIDPDVVLLDEPFSALDYQTKLLLERDVLRIIRANRKTALLVTHDIEEAVSMSDRVIVLSGRPAQVKNVYAIGLTVSGERTPLSSRDAPEFRTYCKAIWEDLDIERRTD